MWSTHSITVYSRLQNVDWLCLIGPQLAKPFSNKSVLHHIQGWVVSAQVDRLSKPRTHDPRVVHAFVMVATRILCANDTLLYQECLKASLSR